MISTAMGAAVGKGEAFDRGRDFAALVGLQRQLDVNASWTSQISLDDGISKAYQ